MRWNRKRSVPEKKEEVAPHTCHFDRRLLDTRASPHGPCCADKHWEFGTRSYECVICRRGTACHVRLVCFPWKFQSLWKQGGCCRLWRRGAPRRAGGEAAKRGAGSWKNSHVLCSRGSSSAFRFPWRPTSMGRGSWPRWANLLQLLLGRGINAPHPAAHCVPVYKWGAYMLRLCTLYGVSQFGGGHILCEGFLVRLWGRVPGRRRHRVPGAPVDSRTSCRPAGPTARGLSICTILPCTLSCKIANRA